MPAPRNHRPPFLSAVVLATAVLAASVGACSAVPALERPPTLSVLIGLLAATVVLNTMLTAALFAAWDRLRTRRRLRESLYRELRHLRHLATPEGVLRKVGLLRDLNAQGSVPEELEGCELAEADLTGVRLAGCSLRGANLAGANLQGAVLDGADLFGAVLSGANLALASLRGASLRGSRLDGAQLIKADLSEANLHRAHLVQADLHRANLHGARITLARFARPEAGRLPLTLHPSVEDWIRARLDADGRYRDAAVVPPPSRLPEAG